MQELLRDPIWQFIGAAISLFALVVAVIGIKFQLAKKTLSYSVIEDLPVFFILEEHRPRLKITYDNQEIKDLRTVDICIKNDGNVPILEGDFSSYLSIEFPQGVRPISSSVTHTTPKNLGITVSNIGPRFVASPVLLNPNDSFSVRFLIESETHVSPIVQARIVGVSDIPRKPHSESYSIWGLLLGYRFRIIRLTILIIIAIVTARYLYDLLTKFLLAFFR